MRNYGESANAGHIEIRNLKKKKKKEHVFVIGG